MYNAFIFQTMCNNSVFGLITFVVIFSIIVSIITIIVSNHCMKKHVKESFELDESGNSFNIDNVNVSKELTSTVPIRVGTKKEDDGSFVDAATISPDGSITGKNINGVVMNRLNTGQLHFDASDLNTNYWNYELRLTNKKSALRTGIPPVRASNKYLYLRFDPDKNNPRDFNEIQISNSGLKVMKGNINIAGETLSAAQLKAIKQKCGV